MELLPQFHRKFDMVFADPPYFLSNGGLTINNGKIVSVNKGDYFLLLLSGKNQESIRSTAQVLKKQG